MSRPHCDSRAVALGFPDRDLPVEPEPPQPSSGSAAAGYRSAKCDPAAWFSNYHGILDQAGADCREAQSFQRVSKRLYQDTEAAALKAQAEVTCLLGERLQDIHGWKSELQRHVERLQADTGALLALKTRLERALDATETPYAIATDNLNCRARRLGPDLVRDSVEEELLKVIAQSAGCTVQSACLCRASNKRNTFIQVSMLITNSLINRTNIGYTAFQEIKKHKN